MAFGLDTASTSKLLLVLILPILSFGALDSYFLQLERKYRLLYDYIHLLSENTVDFSLDISQVSPAPSMENACFPKANFATVDIYLYLLLSFVLRLIYSIDFLLTKERMLSGILNV